MNHKGISLISVVITVVVLIIIAFIATNSGEGAGEMANKTTFMSDMDNIKMELAILRANNFEKYSDAEEGFSEVTVIDAPEDFISFSDDPNQVTGYVVDISKLSSVPYYGTGTISDAQVFFDSDDVLVYDKNGTVFYAKGYEDGDIIYYNATVYRTK